MPADHYTTQRLLCSTCTALHGAGWLLPLASSHSVCSKEAADVARGETVPKEKLRAVAQCSSRALNLGQVGCNRRLLKQLRRLERTFGSDPLPLRVGFCLIVPHRVTRTAFV